MRSNYKKLGDYIQQVSVKNKDLAVTNLLGVSITKEFIPSIANTIGTDMSKYKVVKKGQFTYGSITSRNGDKISIALLGDDDAIVSTSYTVFEIIDTNELIPEYLMMWFRREEFDRYARYMSHGSTREAFGWDEMCDVELPIPSLEKQTGIVKEYHTITDRIKLNEQLNQKLEDTAQSIYKEWFVNFEFPHNFSHSELDSESDIKPYKSNGGEMEYCDELDIEMPTTFKSGYLEEVIDIFDSQRIPLSGSDRENMKKSYPYYGAASLMDYVEDYIFDGKYILLGEDGTVMTEKGYPILQYVYGKFWVNNHAHILKGKNGFDENSLFVLLNNTNISDIITGGVQAKISQTNLKTVKISIPPKELLIELNKKLKPIFDVKVQTLEIKKICFTLKEVILSKMAIIEG